MERKTALITGAARGIGREIAETLAQEKYQLIIIDKHFPKDFDKFVDQLTEDNVPHLILQVDVTNKKERQWLLDELKNTFGGLDGIVNNAGIHNKVEFKDLTEAHYDHTLDVNLKGAIFLTQELLPLMHAQSSIVFISSIRAYVGSNHGLDYAVSKSGMLGATRALAVELAPNVRVNAVAPFSIDTDMIADDSKQTRQQRVDETLLKRIGTPTDVANAVEFLLSDKSSYITGQVLHVNGGAYFG